MNKHDNVVRRFHLFIHKHLGFYIELHAVISEQVETSYEAVDFSGASIEVTHIKKIVMPVCIEVMFECVAFIPIVIKVIDEMRRFAQTMKRLCEES